MYDTNNQSYERSFCSKNGRKYSQKKTTKHQKDLFDAYSNLPELNDKHKSGSAYLQAGGKQNCAGVSLKSKLYPLSLSRL